MDLGRSLTWRRRGAFLVAAAATAAAAIGVARSCTDAGSEPAPPDTRSSGSAGLDRPEPRSRTAPAGNEVPAEAKTVAVTVRTSDGTPLAGATVEVFSAPAGDEFSDMDAFAFEPSFDAPAAATSTRTDALGAAHVALPAEGRWFLVASAPGRAKTLRVASTDRADEEMSAVLQTPHDFGGTMRDPQGRALAGVTVILAPHTATAAFPCDALCSRTRTDDEGRFAFDDVIAGEHRLWFRIGDGPPRCAASVEIPAVGALDVVVPRGAVIAGRVVDDETGAAVCGARLRVLGYFSNEGPRVAAEGKTDASGAFELPTYVDRCAVGEVQVHASDYVILPPSGVRELSGADSVWLGDGDRFESIVRVRRGTTVMGTVRGPRGAVAGAEVSVRPANGLSRRTQTRVDGTYSVETLPGGSLSHWIEAAGFATWKRESDDVVALGTTLVVDADLLPATHGLVQGRVVADEDGAPIAGASVTIGTGVQAVRVTSDSDGSFAVSAARDDDVRISAVAAGRDRASARAPEDGTPVELRLARFARLNGRVADGHDRPIAAARVEIYVGEPGQDCFLTDWSSLRETATATDGTFTVPLVGDGMPILRAWDPVSGVETYGKLGADPSVAVRQREATPFEGRVVDSSTSEPIAGAWVATRTDFFGETDEVVRAISGTDGRFRVEHPPLGPFETIVRAHGYEPSEAPSAPAGDTALKPR